MNDSKSVIQAEVEFRRKPTSVEGGSQGAVISRWTLPDVKSPVELITNPAHVDGAHIITYALKPTNASISHNGREFHRGNVAPGRLLMTGPFQALRTVQKAPFDGIRMYLDQNLLAESYEEGMGRSANKEIVLTDPTITGDHIIESLMQAIYFGDKQGGPFVPSFVEGIGLAIGARLLTLDHQRTMQTPRRAEPLVKWRLKRTTDFITENLHRPIYLMELAAVAGLSRMRFAIQFKEATGFSPHEFILRRKAERAQELLLDGSLGVVDVALLLGFRSQAHFSSVFKRFIGESPARWRAQQT